MPYFSRDSLVFRLQTSTVLIMLKVAAFAITRTHAQHASSLTQIAQRSCRKDARDTQSLRL